MPSIEIMPRVKRFQTYTRYEFLLSYPDNRDDATVYYEVSGDVTQPDNFDGVLFALVFHAMNEGYDLKLVGPASVEALLNLKEFQLAWSRWLPLRYRPINIEASHLLERAPIGSNKAISAFSGGVDATFTLFNHAPSKSGLHHKLSGSMLVHGFDIALHNQHEFDNVFEKAEQLHETLGIETLRVKTNIKLLGLQDWEDSHGAQIASCLHLVSQEFSTGLIGSTEAYDALVIPWGSNPITDHLLSGSAMQILHDGAGFSRTEKVKRLTQIPNAIDNLRVCWEGKRQDRNCGKCEKCIRTKMNLLASGVQNPNCFDEQLEAADVDSLKIKNTVALGELKSILNYADENEVTEKWVGHLRRRVKRGIDKSSRKKAKELLARVGLLEPALTAKRRLIR